MAVLVISGIVPFIASFWPALRFWRAWRPLLYSISLIVLIFGGWDVFATWRGHWSFNPDGVWPLRVLNLPVEEVLFFVVIPFCCVFSWEAFKFFKSRVR